MSRKYVTSLVGVLLISVFLLAQTHTGAVLDVAQTWSAIQTFNGGFNTYNLESTSGSPYTLLGISGYYWNNSGGAFGWHLDAPVVGKQYCFGNASGQTGVLTITSTTSVYIVYKGINGTVTSGTLVSGGAAGDFICMEAPDTTHYNVTGAGYGTWTNN